MFCPLKYLSSQYLNEAVHTYCILNHKIGSDRKWHELTKVTCADRFHPSGLVLCFHSLRSIQKLFINFSRTLKDCKVKIGVMLSLLAFSNYKWLLCVREMFIHTPICRRFSAQWEFVNNLILLIAVEMIPSNWTRFHGYALLGCTDLIQLWSEILRRPSYGILGQGASIKCFAQVNWKSTMLGRKSGEGCSTMVKPLWNTEL